MSSSIDRIAERQDARLGEAVGQRQRVLLAKLGIAAFVITPRRDDEVAHDRFGALVQQLVERVLRVRPDLTPQDRAGVVIGGFSVARHALAVAFHFELLEVWRQVAQAPVVGQDRMRADVEEIDVPDTDHREHHRQVLFERGFAKVAVHRVRAFEHLAKRGHADLERDRQADSRPHRVAPADPVPQIEPAVGRNPPGGHFVAVRRYADEVAPVERLVGRAAGLAQPLQRGIRIRQRIDGGKGFRRYDEQGGRRVEGIEPVGDLAAVHRRNEIDTPARGPRRDARRKAPCSP